MHQQKATVLRNQPMLVDSVNGVASADSVVLCTVHYLPGTETDGQAAMNIALKVSLITSATLAGWSVPV